MSHIIWRNASKFINRSYFVACSWINMVRFESTESWFIWICSDSFRLTALIAYLVYAKYREQHLHQYCFRNSNYFIFKNRSKQRAQTSSSLSFHWSAPDSSAIPLSAKKTFWPFRRLKMISFKPSSRSKNQNITQNFYKDPRYLVKTRYMILRPVHYALLVLDKRPSELRYRYKPNHNTSDAN